MTGTDSPAERGRMLRLRPAIQLAIPHDDVDLADTYVEAFEKVITHYHNVRKEHAR